MALLFICEWGIFPYIYFMDIFGLSMKPSRIFQMIRLLTQAQFGMSAMPRRLSPKNSICIAILKYAELILYSNQQLVIVKRLFGDHLNGKRSYSSGQTTQIRLLKQKNIWWLLLFAKNKRCVCTMFFFFLSWNCLYIFPTYFSYIHSRV